MEKKYPIGEVRVYFVFKHPETGEEISSKLYTPLELLDTDLSIINEMTCVCDCKPEGETNVVECNCEDYYQDFEFHSYHVEVHQPPAEAERGKEITVFVPCHEDDPRLSGCYQSLDGQSLCNVRETTVPVVGQGPGWVKGVPQLKSQHFAKVRSMIEDDVIYDAIIWPIQGSEYWWCVGKGFKFDAPPSVIIDHLDESAGEKEVKP